MPRDTRRGQARAQAARSEGENAGKAPRPAAAEGDGARAADVATRGREPGRGQGTGRTRRGWSKAPRLVATESMERSEEPWASKGTGTGTRRARASAVQARTHGTDKGTEACGPGKRPKGKGKGAVGPRG